ncbi:hypothetical protein ABH15_06850 [Methanoculleus taiwanensis]|uniref:Uncharacterized protein n=1 Tax=Methanoculleus taiwanensis TaxID=1550565 RepID=A0A498H1L5_9EURY|nr:hypothetical protein ABH15_06850 [Methanoculleus taiwanensis]
MTGIWYPIISIIIMHQKTNKEVMTIFINENIFQLFICKRVWLRLILIKDLLSYLASKSVLILCDTHSLKSISTNLYHKSHTVHIGSTLSSSLRLIVILLI